MCLVWEDIEIDEVKSGEPPNTIDEWMVIWSKEEGKNLGQNTKEYLKWGDTLRSPWQEDQCRRSCQYHKKMSLLLFGSMKNHLPYGRWFMWHESSKMREIQEKLKKIKVKLRWMSMDLQTIVQIPIGATPSFPIYGCEAILPLDIQISSMCTSSAKNRWLKKIINIISKIKKC